MIEEFQSATFACSYFSAAPRTVSQAWSPWSAHSIVVGLVDAYGERNVLEIFCRERSLQAVSRAR